VVLAPAQWIPAQGRDDDLRGGNAQAMLFNKSHHPSKLTFNRSTAGMPSAANAYTCAQLGRNLVGGLPIMGQPLASA
jgi:hypothetical protein